MTAWEKEREAANKERIQKNVFLLALKETWNNKKNLTVLFYVHFDVTFNNRLKGQ